MGLIVGGIWMVSEQDFGILREKVDRIEKTMDKFDRTIFGNGKEGLYEMAKNQSAQLNSMTSKLDAFISELRVTQDEFDCLEDRIDKQENRIENHLADPKRTFKFFVVDNWKAIISIILGLYLLLQLIVPSDWTVWDLFAKIF